jgi:hypothetical protein
LAKLFSGLSPILDTSQNPFKKDFYCGRVQSLKTFIVEECKVSKLILWMSAKFPNFFLLDGPIKQDNHLQKVLNFGMHPITN